MPGVRGGSESVYPGSDATTTSKPAAARSGAASWNSMNDPGHP